MPKAPKICGTQDCINLVRGGTYCPEHAKQKQERWGTDRTAQAGHKARRARILKRDPHCMLRLTGCTGTSTVCDHIVPLAVLAPGIGDHDANCRGVCSPCDKKITSKQAHWIAGHNVQRPWTDKQIIVAHNESPPIAIAQAAAARTIWIA